MTRYAVNTGDLMLMPSIVAELLIAPVRGKTININKSRFDEMAVELECDEERAEAIVAVIRVRFGRNNLRCYKRGDRGEWKQI